MAYIDQDRSREKTVSGAVSLAVIGVVGYGLVSGLAMTVMPTVTWLTPAKQWKIPVPPPEKKLPPKTEKTTQQHPTTDPVPHPDPLPIPDLGPKTGDPTPFPIPTFPTSGLGGGDGPAPQPQPIDHSAGAVPRSAPGTWVTTDDYPPSAVRAGIEGRTSFRLDIGTDGKPANCTVLASSGSDDLDKTACRKLMNRARFKPALDMAGNPTATTYAGGVTWKLPAE
jgi:periplasmic protein TonB